jgi:hypothetical protein
MSTPSALAANTAVADRAWWRTERQTFIPLPERQQAVFTIHVQVQPPGRRICPRPGMRRLSEAIASMSPAVLDYRNLGTVRQPAAGLAGRTRQPRE